MSLGDRIKYRPDIDGLRALAVVLVVLYHAGQGCRGGFIGVDVFFVLSGYLITSQLLRQMEQRSFSFAAFWERRVRRLFPALFVLLLVVGLLGWALLLPPDARQLGATLLAQPVLLANFVFWHNAAYFAGPSELKPLLHTWSLAVEEQFYLLYPLLLWLLTRRSRIAAGLSAMSLASLLLSVWATAAYPQAAFYLLPTRAWELLVGALLVLAPPGPQRGGQALATFGVAAILAAAVVYEPATPFPGMAAVLPCAGTALTLWATSARPSWLGCRPAVWLGRVSYSWYLWHWPLFAFARYWSLTPLRSNARWGLVLLSLLLATVSWRWVENPVRSRALLGSRRALALAIAGAALLLTGLGATLLLVPRPLPAAAANYADTEEPAWGPMLSLAEAQRGELVTLGKEQGPIDFVLWGDSHALVLRPAVDAIARKLGRRGAGAFHGATLPLLDYVSSDPDALKEHSPAYNQAILHYVRANKVPRVLLAARWTNYRRAGLVEALQHTVGELRNAGCQIWVLKQVPEHPVNVPRALTREALLALPAAPLLSSLAHYQERSAWFDEVLSSQGDHVQVLDPTRRFYPVPNAVVVSLNGRSLYWDTNHLTRDGGDYLSTLLEQALR